tara:strand:- start:64 stop:357 length:294 start_codon:yes stop_codon:yes gene_type:complete
MDIAANKAKDFSGYCATHLPENVAADKQYFANLATSRNESQMTDRKIADGCYHTSEFANLPERCDLPNGCHKGHLWIVDGKEQHHAPDANKYNRNEN